MTETGFVPKEKRAQRESRSSERFELPDSKSFAKVSRNARDRHFASRPHDQETLSHRYDPEAGG